MRAAHGQGLYRAIVVFLGGIFIAIRAAPEEDSVQCNFALGLESSLPDDAFKASVGNMSHLARLNNEKGAWCFEKPGIDAKDQNAIDNIHLTVTLPEPKIVTGFRIQGPPAALFGASYGHGIALDVSVSSDSEKWIPVNSTETFYTNDDGETMNQIDSYSWNSSLVALYVRITVIAKNSMMGDLSCLRFEILGCGGDDVMPVTNLSVVASEKGTLEVVWNHPLLWTDDDQPMRVKVTDYKLIYSLNVEAGRVETNSSVTKKRKVQLTNAFLGAEYNFELTCFVGDLNFNCRSLSIYTYPSCPSYEWYQIRTTCFHRGSQERPWPEVKAKCEKVFKDPSNVLTSSSPPIGTSMWLGSKECIDYPPKQVEKLQCCGSLPNAAEAVKRDTCPAIDTKQPFACVLQNKVVFATINKISISSPNSKSAKISWSYEGTGWKPFTLITKLSTTDGSVISQKESTFDPHVIYDGLNVNTYYVVEIFSSVDSSKMNYSKKFYMSAEGALGNVDLDIFIVWEGKLRLEWEKAQAESSDKIVPATNYQLEWSIEKENVKQKISTTNLMFEINFPALAKLYQFILRCEVSKIIFICAEKQLNTGIQENVLVEKENTLLIIYTYHEINLDWKSSNEICIKHGGFLTSILSIAEQTTVQKLTQTGSSYWIGGTNCKTPNPSWIDGSNWKYMLHVIKPFSEQKCCLQMSHTEKGIKGEPEICDLKRPFVCKVYNPDVVEEVKDLKAKQVSSNKILLTWNQPSAHWQPDVYIISKCLVDTPCMEETRVKTSSAALIPITDPSSSHKFQVESVLTSMKDFKKSESVEITSLPAMQVDYTLSAEGEMKLKWTSKVNEDKGKNQCVVTFFPTDQEKEIQSMKGLAEEIVITGLQVATSYSFTLTENGGGSYSFVVVLHPSCGTDDVQHEKICYRKFSQTQDWKTAEKDCIKHGFRLANPSSVEKQLTLSLKSKKESQKFWINYSNLYSKNKEEVTANNADAICHAVIPTMQDVIIENCDSKLQFICEKETEVRMLPVSSLMVKQNETAARITWSPSKSWKAAYYLVTVEKNTAKSKRSPVTPIKVNSTTYVVADLEPGTSYSIDVAPVTQISDRSFIQGEHEKQTFETLKITTSEPEVESAIANGEDINNLNMYNSSVPDSLRVFHIIGCSTLIGLVGLATLIFLFAGMWSFRDGLAQLSMQISLLIVHILLLMMLEFPDQIDFHSASISIHFFYTACFSFIMVESILYAKALTTVIPPSVLSSRTQVLAIGWAPVLLVIGLSAGLLYDYYPQQYHCWVKLDTDVLYATVIPIGIFATVSLGLLAACICCRPTHNYEVDEESYIRERVMENMRWIILLILALLSISWACGMVGMDQSDEVLLLVFIIFNIILGVTILILRCLGDTEVRLRLKNCCSSSKVSPETNGLEAFIPKKGMENPDKFKLSPPQSAPVQGTRESALMCRSVGGRQCGTSTLPSVD